MPESFITTGHTFGPITCHRGVTAPAVIDIGPDIHLHLAHADDARELLKAAAEALAILDPPVPDDALNDQTAPYWPNTVVPLNAGVQPAFCADCGAPEGLVPLVCEAGVCRCWDGERCDERQARAAGYGLNGGTS